MPVTTIVEHEYHATIPEGDVIRTEPESGADIGPDTVVTVWVSDGPAPSTGGAGFPAVSQFGGMLIGANG